MLSGKEQTKLNTLNQLQRQKKKKLDYPVGQTAVEETDSKIVFSNGCFAAMPCDDLSVSHRAIFGIYLFLQCFQTFSLCDCPECALEERSRHHRDPPCKSVFNY